jgi:hypothetical protein
MEPLSLVIPIFNETKTIGALIHEIPAAYRLDCESAWGPDADQRRKSMILLVQEGSESRADSHQCQDWCARGAGSKR